MKKKLALVLCACAMLAGCSHAVSFTNETVESVENKTSTTDDSEKDEASSVNNDAEEGTKEESSENEETLAESSEEKEDASKDSEQSDEKSGVIDGDTQVDRTNFNAYDKAAYFADRVYQENKKNTLVSPISLNLALGLAAQGADGDTARELAKYLDEEDYASWAEKYMNFAESLTEDPNDKKRTSSKDDRSAYDIIDENGGYTFRYEIANSLWVDKQYRLQDAYRDIVQRKFDAEVDNVDFVNEKEKSADLINSWCNEKTRGLIPKIVEPNMFPDELATVLVNSLYFESPWQDKWRLTKHEFTDFDGKATEKEMLYDGDLHTYYENDKAIAFSKNYYNGFQFIGILPKKTGEFEIRDLDLKSLMDSKTNEYEVHAIAPKLDFECFTDKVIDILQEQGVQKAFDRNIGFSHMVEDKPVFIEKILQKCKIEMDENGTKAAAVTAMMMKVGSAMMEEPQVFKEVILDRPFAFMIYDSQNDQILFVGKVTNVD